jgi:hypothetical protein
MLSPCFRAANFLRRVRTTSDIDRSIDQMRGDVATFRLASRMGRIAITSLAFFLCPLLGRFQLLP